jgi:hypothetical protein
MYGIDATKIKGRILLGATISPDQTNLTLLLDGGTIATFEVDGDCCSVSWIEHVTYPQFGGQILDITEPELPPPDGFVEEPNDYSVIRYYHTAIQTTRDELIVEYRNSSNGYYGGEMHGPTLTESKIVRLSDAFH